MWNWKYQSERRKAWCGRIDVGEVEAAGMVGAGVDQ